MQRTDNYGNVLSTYQYDAFGNLVWQDYYDEYLNPFQNNNPFRFTGQYWDWELGEYYLRARSYNPSIGRFTQPDPHWGIHNMIFGDVPIFRAGRMVPSRHAILQAGNLYVYAMNNPLMYVDPSGRVAAPIIVPFVLPLIPKSVDFAKTKGPTISQQAKQGARQIAGFVFEFLVLPLFTFNMRDSLQSGTRAMDSNVQVAQAPAPVASSKTQAPASSTASGQGSDTATPADVPPVAAPPGTQVTIRTGRTIEETEGQPPNSRIRLVDESGRPIKDRLFGPDGRAIRDIHHTDHGNPKNHPHVPHWHPWECGRMMQPGGLPMSNWHTWGR